MSLELPYTQICIPGMSCMYTDIRFYVLHVCLFLNSHVTNILSILCRLRKSAHYQYTTHVDHTTLNCSPPEVIQTHVREILRRTRLHNTQQTRQHSSTGVHMSRTSKQHCTKADACVSYKLQPLTHCSADYQIHQLFHSSQLPSSVIPITRGI